MGRRFLEQDEHRRALLIARSTRAASYEKKDFLPWVEIEETRAGLR